MKIKKKIITYLSLLSGILFPTVLFAQECQDTSYVMDKIVAAFNTEGYWVLNDLINQIEEYDLSIWAVVIYIFVVLGGLIGAAMGMPPKKWVWWVFGPILYDFLVFTPDDRGRYGVCWVVGTEQQDQRQVWEAAEVGLINLNAAAFTNYNRTSQPSEPAKRLPMAFVAVDDVISDQIGFLVQWAGMNSERKNPGQTYMHEQPKTAPVQNLNPWNIMSNLKWPILEDVASASLSDPDTKEAFARFMASECGDLFAEYIDKASYVSASSSKGGKLPETIIREENVQKLKTKMENLWVPYPQEIRRILNGEPDPKKSAVGFNGNMKKLAGEEYNPKRSEITCMEYFYVIVQSFRWEAGMQYNQIFANKDVKIVHSVYSFLYGWDVKDEAGGNGYVSMTVDQQKRFVQDLILMHLIRNEMATTYTPIDRNYTSTERSENYVKEHFSTVGSKNKYGELYVWSTLMPYMQGTTLFVLCAIYPFCCMLMIIPGWHKALLYWIGFYTWAKSWDAGFALVKSLERSIWAMIGKSGDGSTLNGRIFKMGEDRYGSYLKVQCDDGNDDCRTTLTPAVTDEGNQTATDSIKTFSQGMLLSGRLDLDESNAYYVYLVSALYMIVPAVTGQLILGAKGAIAGMVTSGIAHAAKSTGSGAGSGYTAEQDVDQKNNRAVTEQERMAKSMRNDGKGLGSFATRAIQSSNNAAMFKMRQKTFSANIAMKDALKGQVDNAISGTGAKLSKLTGMVNVGGGFSNQARGVIEGSAGIAQAKSGIVLGEMKAKRDLESAKAQAEAEKAGALAGRYEAAAQQAAREKKWLANRRLARQVAGRLGAIGMDVSGMAGTQKPNDMYGMASQGMLGKNVDYWMTGMQSAQSELNRSAEKNYNDVLSTAMDTSYFLNDWVALSAVDGRTWGPTGASIFPDSSPDNQLAPFGVNSFGEGNR